MTHALFTLVLLVMVCTQAAHAAPGAWLQPEGEGQMITSALLYGSAERFDTQGQRVSAGHYSKREINPYVEYGVDEALTVGGSAFLQAVESGDDTNYGIAELELFARTPLLTFDRGVVSLQPMVKLPGLRSEASPALGSTHPDVGLSVISGMHYSVWGTPIFMESETGVRLRAGAPGNQYRAHTTLGVQVTPDVLLLAQGFSTWRSIDMAMATFTQSSADDYDLVKAQGSAVYQYTPALAFQFGIFADVYGRNTGAGQGALVAVWSRF